MAIRLLDKHCLKMSLASWFRPPSSGWEGHFIFDTKVHKAAQIKRVLHL